MDSRQPLVITTNNALQTIGSPENLRTNAPGNLSVEKPTVEQMNEAIGAASAYENSPFGAAHPDVAGKRNSIRIADEESITLGPVQKIHPRQHANAKTLLRSKKSK